MRMRHHLCRLLLLFLACVSAPGLIAAEDRDRRDDSRPSDASSPSKDFEFTFTIPFLYSSSVVRSDTDTVIREVGDRHVDPDFELKWSRQFSGIKMSAFVAATLERYATVREADVDTLTAAVKMELTDGRSDLFIPYLEYERTVDFTPFFRAREATLHDFAVGFTSGTGVRKDGRRIRYRSADEPGRTAFKLDVKAGRRLADPGDLNRVFVETDLDIAYTISKQWTVILTPSFKARWYDSYFGQSRRDYRPSLELKAEWTPDWLTKSLPDAAIEFSILFERNYSNLVDQRYKLYEVGPTVVLSSKF